MSRRRLDTLLAERGLAGSRSSAAASIRAGRVRVGAHGRRADKPGQLVAEDVVLAVDEGARYVSRGGVKLENAIRALELDMEERSCLDVGASTGGFTDCLLQHGAARVIAVDVGYGQLDWGLRQDARVHVLERTNARSLRPADLPYRPEFATVDVSFISLTKVLPAVAGCLAPGGEILALVKPQFELKRERVGKGGVVRDPADRRDAVVAVARAARGLGLGGLGFTPSGVQGPKGNLETFAHLGLGRPGVEDLESAAQEVEL